MGRVECRHDQLMPPPCASVAGLDDAPPDAPAPTAPIAARVPWQTVETAGGRIDWQILDGEYTLPGRRLLVVEYGAANEQRVEAALRELVRP